MTVRSAATALRPYPAAREWSARVGLPRAAEVDLADKLGQVVIVVLFTLLAVRMGRDFLETARITGLLLLTGELLVVALTVLRRPAMFVDRSWRARLLTGCSLVGPPLVAPLASGGLLSDTVTAIASAGGPSHHDRRQAHARRSFGLMPANRGIVCTGLYRAVRHPIYAGYLVTHIGFPDRASIAVEHRRHLSSRTRRFSRARSVRKERWRGIPSTSATWRKSAGGCFREFSRPRPPSRREALRGRSRPRYY